MPDNAANAPLAIVGIGCLFPKADGLGGYWANVKHGVDGIGNVPSTHWDPADYFDADPKAPDMTYARRGGFLDAVPFNPLEFGIAPRDLEATDTTQLLGLVAAKRALQDAGVVFKDAAAGTPGKNPVDRNRVSVILGVTGTLELVIPLGARLGHPKWKRAMHEAGIPADQADDACRRIADSYVPWQENSFPGLLGNVAAGRIANRLDLGGTNCVVDAACASSLSAVHLAALELQAGRCDVAVTGGADTFNDIFMFMCFSKTPALSPTGNAKPFDANGDGTILGEGIGLVVLKRLADAERDGDRVYAVLKGIGSSSDGKGGAIYAPMASGQKKAIRNAYKLANVTPDTIELVEAHGTGTKVGDSVEASALAEVYGEASGNKPRPWCAVGSVKSQIGHTKAAAGSASLIKAALAVYNKVLPPTLKVTQPVEPLRAADSPFYVNTAMRPWLPRREHPRRAALSAFGFGGSNFHAVLEEHRPEKPEPDWDGTVEILAISGATAQAVADAAAKVPTAWPEFARAAEKSRGEFDPAAACRLVLAARRDSTDLLKLLANATAKLAADPAAKAWHTPDGAFYGSGAAGPVGLLFPGQGSQAVGMLRELVGTFPEALETVAVADRVVAEQNPDESDPRRLSDRIYPPTSFAPDAKAQQDAALRATDVAQPAIGAVSLAAFRVLRERFGLAPAAFAGHSYGELVALAAAGRLSPADLFHLSRLRGRLMASQPAGGDAGGMLAVLAPLADVEAAIEREKLNVVVANKNAPKQVVLSGPTKQVEKAEAAFSAAGVRCTRLPVAAAFHSPLVADAAAPFRAALDGVPLPAGGGPVYANTTAAEYPADPAAARDLLGFQLANPVAFADEVTAMHAAGVRTFLEVGPGSVLTKLAEATLTAAGATDAQAFALDASGGKKPGLLDLGLTLARLAAAGHPVALAAWEAGSRCRPAPPPPAHAVPICGANHVAPRPKRPARPPAPPSDRSLPSRSDPVVSPAMPDPAPGPAVNPAALAPALDITHQTLTALQRLQEQTAQLHKQFLESQQQAQQTLFALVAQQQAILFPGTAVAPAPVPAPVPVHPPAPAPVPAARDWQADVAPPPAPTPVVFPAKTAPLPVAATTRTVPPAAVATPAVPAPVPTPKPTANGNGKHTAAPASSAVMTTLLEVVAEKTGYPVTMLDPGMALDADLGVDSIKRVEILSALQDRLPGAPQVKPEHLGALHTLKDVADFLAGVASAAPAPAGGDEIDLDPIPTMHGSSIFPNSTGEAAAQAAAASADIQKVLLEVVAEKTGYPVTMLDPGMALDADLGVDSIKRVEILSALQDRLPGAPQVKPEHLGALHTLKDVADFLAGVAGETTPGTAKLAVVPQPAAAAAPPPSTTLTADDAPPATDVFRAGTPPIHLDRIDRSILQVVDLDPANRPRLPVAPGGEAWVVGPDDPFTQELVARLGTHGLVPKLFPWADPDGVRPAGQPVALVLVAPTRVPPGLALNKLGFRWLQAVGAKVRHATRQTGSGLLATVARLDGAFGLADLSPDADPTPGGLAGLVKTARYEWPEVASKAVDVSPSFAASNPAGAAAAVADELLAAGPTEVGVAASHRVALELARTVRRHEPAGIVLGPKDVVVVTGGARGVTAEAAVALAEVYQPTLILTGRTPTPGGPEPDWLRAATDEAAMKKAIAEHLGPAATPKAVGEAFARLSAQREIARTIARVEKAGARVAYFPVNITNGRAVADFLHQVQVKFGPVTGLIHGAGVLADRKIEDLTADQFDMVYSTKVDGVRHLLDLLGPQELKAIVLFSSTTARFGRTGQLAYACANEVLNKTAQAESRRRPNARVVAINWGPWDGGMVTPGLRKVFESEGIGLIPLAEGGLFLVQELTAAGQAVEVVALGKGKGAKPGSGVVRTPAPPSVVTMSPPSAYPGLPAPGAGELVPAFERTLDIATHPVLRSHVLDGRAVLPMALHMEWLAHAALHGNPGLVFHGFNDLRITHGVMVEDGASTVLRALAGKAVKLDKGFHVQVELRGKRRDGREAIHSRAEVVLTGALPKAPPAGRLPDVQPYPHPVDEVYKYFLFHGPDLQGIERVEGLAETAFVATAYPAPPPAEWFHGPMRSAWVADPLVLDSAFQMMILWSFAQHGAGSLPCFAGRYRQYRRAFPAGPVKVVIRVTRDNGAFARADVDFLDADGLVIAQMQDYECVIDRQLDQAFRRNQLAPKAKA